MEALRYSANKENHKIGRNDPCFCGSGRKYKQCCLAANSNDENEGDDLQTQQGLLQNLMNRVQGQHKDKECIIGTSEEMGLVSMSDIIVEFAEDLLDMAESPTAQENMLTLAITAWNLAIVTESEEKDTMPYINDFLRISGSDEDSHLKKALTILLRALVERKHRDYAHIHRYIEDFDITMKKGTLHLNIASTLVPPSKKLKKPLLPRFSGKKKKQQLLEC